MNQRNIGIYLIQCGTNNKSYIGSSKDIYQRFKHHRRDLRNNKHHNSHLQAAWNKYGEIPFSFSIIELCTMEELLSRETFYIELYQSMITGFNQQMPKDLKINNRIKNRETGLIIDKPRKENNIPIICINMKTKEVTKYRNPKHASIETNTKYNKVTDILRYWKTKVGAQKSVKGLIFIREEDYNPDIDYISIKKQEEKELMSNKVKEGLTKSKIKLVC